MLIKQLIEHPNFVHCSFVGQTKKNDAMMWASFAKDFISEASIISNQNASFNLRNLHNLVIINSASLIVN